MLKAYTKRPKRWRKRMKEGKNPINNPGNDPRRRRKKYLPQIAVRLPPDWIKEFDEAAQESGYKTRSDIFREILVEWVEKRRRERKK